MSSSYNSPLKISFFFYFIMNFQIESKCTHTHTWQQICVHLLYGSRRAQWKISNGLFRLCFARLWTRKIITEKNRFVVEISSNILMKNLARVIKNVIFLCVCVHLHHKSLNTTTTNLVYTQLNWG